MLSKSIQIDLLTLSLPLVSKSRSSSNSLGQAGRTQILVVHLINFHCVKGPVRLHYIMLFQCFQSLNFSINRCDFVILICMFLFRVSFQINLNGLALPSG